jgi:hypothetical protein
MLENNWSERILNHVTHYKIPENFYPILLQIIERVLFFSSLRVFSGTFREKICQYEKLYLLVIFCCDFYFLILQ